MVVAPLEREGSQKYSLSSCHVGFGVNGATISDVVPAPYPKACGIICQAKHALARLSARHVWNMVST